MAMIAIYRKTLTILFSLLCSLSALHAASPVWSFTPLTATSISVPGNGSAIVQYLVTNKSAKSHSLVMTPITGITQITSGAGICSNPFTLPTRGSSCTLSLLVQGSQLTQSISDGPIVCQQGSTLQCYKPSPSDVLKINVGANDTTLSASISTLGLSVNDTGLNAALTGTPRQITITNSGTGSATNVTYSLSPALPSGTMISPGSCGTIAVSGSCILTITPGNTPSAAAGDTNPTPITISISGTNTNTLTPTVNILTYGSVYQSGYIYAVDDTTSNTGSIGGSVAALTDQSAGVIWSSDGSSSVSYVAILGVDELSTPITPSPTAPSYPPGTPPYLACNGKSDGACNTSNIVSYYNFNRASGGAPPTPPGQYAAGLCTVTIDNESDWYLPAICEEGYDDIGSGANGCGTQASPAIQNMLSNLFDAGFGGLSGEYWSSTEWAGDPFGYAWSQTYDLGNIPQNTFDKSYSTIKVRCSRALTP